MHCLLYWGLFNATESLMAANLLKVATLKIFRRTVWDYLAAHTHTYTPLPFRITHYSLADPVYRSQCASNLRLYLCLNKAEHSFYYSTFLWVCNIVSPGSMWPSHRRDPETCYCGQWTVPWTAESNWKMFPPSHQRFLQFWLVWWEMKPFKLLLRVISGTKVLRNNSTDLREREWNGYKWVLSSALCYGWRRCVMGTTVFMCSC